MDQHTREWRAEHANFVRLLDLIDAQVAVFHGGGRPDYELMLDVMHYMTRYPDRYHHLREDLAFEAVFERVPDLRALADELAAQHLRIARAGAKLVEDLGAIVDGAVLPRATVEADASAYTRFMRQHMQREEAAIFPALDRVLAPRDWLLIDARVHFVADPMFGEVVQDRYRTLHQRIASQVGCGCAEVGCGCAEIGA